MYMPMQAAPPPIFSSVPVQHLPPQPAMPPPAGCGAALTLGLVHGGQPMPQPMPQPMQPMPQPLQHAPPVHQPPMQLQPMQPMQHPQHPQHPQPLQAQFGLPSYAAPHAAPGVMVHPGQLPPPPTFAAPTVVMSPKGSTQPAMSESLGSLVDGRFGCILGKDEAYEFDSKLRFFAPLRIIFVIK
eukprot:symbB.v1.2.012570.t1/scaffold873.1/size155814/4